MIEQDQIGRRERGGIGLGRIDPPHLGRFFLFATLRRERAFQIMARRRPLRGRLPRHERINRLGLNVNDERPHVVGGQGIVAAHQAGLRRPASRFASTGFPA